MEVIDNVRALRHRLAGERAVGLVPTMGSLHEGHLSLVREARAESSCVVASIFVNRLQFGPGEDFDRYPRSLDNDVRLLAGAGCQVVFAPGEQELYPRPQQVFVEPSPLQQILEGAVRPGHFRGVCTVVMKLFQMVQPQVALFGKKDYQQWRILCEMVEGLALPVRMVGGETIRAADGLALSSRNAYLDASQRAEAPRLHQQLQAVVASLQAMAPPADQSLASVAQQAEHACADGAAVLRSRGWEPDYLSVRRQQDLALPTPGDRHLVVLAAARLGTTRLIDNVEFTLPEFPHG